MDIVVSRNGQLQWSIIGSDMPSALGLVEIVSEDMLHICKMDYIKNSTGMERPSQLDHWRLGKSVFPIKYRRQQHPPIEKEEDKKSIQSTLSLVPTQAIEQKSPCF